MDSKIATLLEKLDLSSDTKRVFETAKLEKIIASKDKTNYCFYIKIDTNLDINIFDEFINKLKVSFNSVKNVGCVFKVDTVNYDLVNDYFKYIIKILSKESSMLDMFLDNKVELNDKELIIYVDNANEEKKLSEYKLKIEEYFNRCGFDISVNYTIDIEGSKKIQEEIEASIVSIDDIDYTEPKPVVEENVSMWKKNYTPKKKITVDDPNVVLGRVIDTSVTRVDALNNDGGIICIEAEIFGVDIRETKTDLRIVTLKLTDRTDSIFGKLFVNDEEEVNRLSKTLKVGKWFKFRGSIKEDKYSNEDVLSIVDINISNHEDVKIIDDAEVKRVELHAHTMMSQMDGVTKLDLGAHTCELVSRTIDMGYRGVAITDHNGCQAFPIAYGIISSHNKDVRKKIKSRIEEIEEILKEDSNN